MPGLDGINATRAITEAFPEIAVLVVSILDDDANIFAAMRAGAWAMWSRVMNLTTSFAPSSPYPTRR